MAFQLDRIGEEADHGGEHHQQEAEPVDAEVVGGADAGNPGGLLLECQVLGAVELEDQRQGDQKSDERRRYWPRA